MIIKYNNLSIVKLVIKLFGSLFVYVYWINNLQSDNLPHQ